MNIFWIVFIIIVYLNIGYFYGLWRWKVNRERNLRSVGLNYSLWPVRTWAESTRRIGRMCHLWWKLFSKIRKRNKHNFINDPNSAIEYAVIMAAVWGLTLLWNIFALIMIGTFFLIWKLFYFFIRTVTWPVRIVVRTTTRVK